MVDPLDFPAGCTAPRLGSQVRRALGEELPTQSALAHHVGTCLACALERRAWQRSQMEPASAAGTVALLRRIEAVSRGTGE